MDKRGVSVIVASVFLFLLTVILGGVIYWQMEQTVLYLAPEPEVDCLGLDFSAEIIGEKQGDYLEVVNLGNLVIEGFYIKRFNEGEIYMYEEIVRYVAPGEDTRISLQHDYVSGKYLVVPRVSGEDLDGGSYLRPCKEIYALEVSVE